MKKLHDEKATAEFLNCSVALLRRMRLQNRGPRYTRVGRLVRYPEDWLQEYVNAHATKEDDAQ